MLRQPTGDHRVFEVSVYNREVRRLVKENRSHRLFDDHWADSQRHDVLAHDEREARMLVTQHFPPDDGLVIESIQPTRL